jgi:hypothetical protein
MLTRVIEIDDLQGARKMQIRQIPDPFGSVAHDNLPLRAAPATVPGFAVDAFSKFFGRLDGSSVGSRIRITNRVAFLVPRGLGEHAAELGFACVRRLAVRLAFASLRLFLDDRYARLPPSANAFILGIGRYTAVYRPELALLTND